jgi:spore coat protein U-like protein
MMIHKKILLAGSLGFGLAFSTSSWATLGCMITLTPPTLAGTYSPANHMDVDGMLVLNCTRRTAAPADAARPYVVVALNQVAGDALAKAAPYADTLNYAIYRNPGRTGLWTTSPSRNAGSTASGALLIRLNFGTAASTTLNVPIYMRAISAQADKAAGVYTDSLDAGVVESDSSGNLIRLLGSVPVASQATVNKNCSFGAGASAYNLAYQAFRNADLIDNTQSITVTCSKGTTYTLSLDNVNGVVPIVELAYGLVFASSSSGTAASTSTTGTAAQTFALRLTLPAGQAGRCTAVPCTGLSTRTITMTY